MYMLMLTHSFTLMLTPLCTHKCTPSRACRRKAIRWRRTAFCVCTLRLKSAHTGLAEVPGSQGLSFLISLPQHEGLLLKVKLQYFGHLMQRAGLLEKTLMLGKIEDKMRRGQRMRWLDSINDSEN